MRDNAIVGGPGLDKGGFVARGSGSAGALRTLCRSGGEKCARGGGGRRESWAEWGGSDERTTSPRPARVGFRRVPPSLRERSIPDDGARLGEKVMKEAG